MLQSDVPAGRNQLQRIRWPGLNPKSSSFNYHSKSLKIIGNHRKLEAKNEELNLKNSIRN